MDSPEFVVRKATVADLAPVLDLRYAFFKTEAVFDPDLNPAYVTSESGQKRVLKAIENPEHICLVAETGGKLIGFLIGELLPLKDARPVKSAELDNVYVVEAWRNKKVATELLHQFKSWCIQHGTKRLVLSTLHKNQVALDFYKSQGFNNYFQGLEIKL